MLQRENLCQPNSHSCPMVPSKSKVNSPCTTAKDKPSRSKPGKWPLSAAAAKAPKDPFVMAPTPSAVSKPTFQQPKAPFLRQPASQVLRVALFHTGAVLPPPGSARHTIGAGATPRSASPSPPALASIGTFRRAFLTSPFRRALNDPPIQPNLGHSCAVETKRPFRTCSNRRHSHD
jgi:hypothetical protein